MFSISTEDYTRVSYSEKSNFTTNAVDSDKSIFKTNCFEYKYDERAVYYNENYKSPREIYEEFKSTEGIISQTIDKLKMQFPIFSILGMKNSQEIEIILEQYDNDEILEFEAVDAVEKYKKNQNLLKELILNVIAFLSMILSLAFFKLCEMETINNIIMSSTLSGAIRFSLEKMEAITNSLNKNTKLQPAFERVRN